MTTAASGGITKAEERIRDMLADCTQFQTWTGAANATAAKLSIYYDAVPLDNVHDDNATLADIVSKRPFAMVYTDPTDGYSFSEINGGGGVVMVELEQNTTPLTDWEEAERLFKITVGKIIQTGDSANPGLVEISRARTYAQITKYDLVELYRYDQDAATGMGDAQGARLRLEWGVRG